MTEKRYAEKYCEDCGAIHSIPDMHKIEKDGRTVGWRCDDCRSNAVTTTSFWWMSGAAFFLIYGLVAAFIAANWFTLIFCALVSLFLGAAGANHLQNNSAELIKKGPRMLAWAMSCAVLPIISLNSIFAGEISGFFFLAISALWARYLYQTKQG